MTEIILFDKKQVQKNSEYIAIDLQELEKYAKNKTYQEFVNIGDQKIGSKAIFEWFKVEYFSLWWFVFPTIYPKLTEAALFIDRLLLFLEKSDAHKITLKGCYDKKNLVEKICKIKNIQFQISSKNNIVSSLQNSSKTKLKKLAYKRSTNDKHKKRINLFNKKRILSKSSKRLCSINISRNISP